MKKLTALLCATFATSAAFAEWQYFDNVEYFYQPEEITSLTSPSRRVYSLAELEAMGTSAPRNFLHFAYGGLNPDAPINVPLSATWPTDYSGLIVTGDLASKQLAQGPTCCDAFQTEAGTQMGWILSSAYTAPQSHVNLQVRYNTGPNNYPQPWPGYWSKLGMEFSIKIPSSGLSPANPVPPAVYVTGQLLIFDVADDPAAAGSRKFWVQPSVFFQGQGSRSNLPMKAISPSTGIPACISSMA